MMTEDEAKTKWCPYARASFYVSATPAGPAESGYAGNRDIGGLAVPNVNCIGSACMAWRKKGQKFKDARTGRLLDIDQSGHGKWLDIGYCGLAGRPE